MDAFLREYPELPVLVFLVVIALMWVEVRKVVGLILLVAVLAVLGGVVVDLLSTTSVRVCLAPGG